MRPPIPGTGGGGSRAGITHDDYVGAVTGFIEKRDLRDVVLVGHSFGGSVVSRVSQEIPDRLKRLVFHTAFVVEDGTSVNDNIPPEQTALFAKAASESPDNTVECPWEVFRDLFIQDARPEDARSVWERLVPQPFQPWADRLELAEFYRAGLPRSYIAVADDRALPEGTWHPGMSSRLGACKIVEMAGSHEVMFTRPAELARKLTEAAND
jgi:pimeloyl-ACP methyl ester carboxylesterase